METSNLITFIRFLTHSEPLIKNGLAVAAPWQGHGLMEATVQAPAPSWGRDPGSSDCTETLTKKRCLKDKSKSYVCVGVFSMLHK